MSLVAFAILISLGIWQLERKAWKEGLIAQIETRAYGEPSPLTAAADWAGWSAGSEEYRRVRLTGTFVDTVEIPVHGLAKPNRQALQGFYVFSPLRLPDGSVVIVNRGFVPTELRDPNTRPGSLPAGSITVTGLERVSEERGAFVPANDPGRSDWFVRNIADMKKGLGLASVAPFYVDADASLNPGGWPRGGQTQVVLSNDHLQYAFTWFGLAATLLGVLATLAWQHLRADGGKHSGRVAPSDRDSVGSS